MKSRYLVIIGLIEAAYSWNVKSKILENLEAAQSFLNDWIEELKQ